MEQVTIRDIARKCKVGVSTVSRAMNNHPDINPETKEMILKVIAESNYVPNNSARNLKRSNAKAIAILVKGMDNMFFNNMISVIEEVVRKKKYACIIERVEEKANEVDSAIEIVKEKRLRGIIFLGGNFTHPHEKMAQIPVPYVISTIGAVSDGGKPCASVSVDGRLSLWSRAPAHCHHYRLRGRHQYRTAPSECVPPGFTGSWDTL